MPNSDRPARRRLHQRAVCYRARSLTERTMHHLIAFGLSSFASLAAATLTVGPGMMFPDITSALAAATAGDLVLVAPGTYGAFVVTVPITIAASSGAFTVTSGATAAIRITNVNGAVTIDGAVIQFASTSAPAIAVSASTDVHLRNITVDAVANLVGTSARAAIEIGQCGAVVLERVAVGTTAVRSAVTTTPDGVNDGVSAVRFVDSQFVLQSCSLRGYAALPGGPYGGDAVRVVVTGAFTPPSAWLQGGNLGQTLIGGSAAGRGGNCLHVLGGGIAVELCNNHFLAPGTGGALAGGTFAINNDGGVIAPGVGRMIPACLFDTAGFASAPAVIATGATLPVAVGDFLGGNPCVLAMSIGGGFVHAVPGLFGRLLLNLTEVGTIGVATTPASFSIVVPANPTLAGLSLTFQGVLVNPNGINGLWTTASARVGVR